MTEHKHAAVLRAIADGKEVEYSVDGRWWPYATSPNPLAHPKFDWRVKPEPKPDFKTYLTVRKGYTGIQTERRYASDTVCLTFDGETGKLKYAVVLE